MGKNSQKNDPAGRSDLGASFEHDDLFVHAIAIEVADGGFHPAPHLRGFACEDASVYDETPGVDHLHGREPWVVVRQQRVDRHDPRRLAERDGWSVLEQGVKVESVPGGLDDLATLAEIDAADAGAIELDVEHSVHGPLIHALAPAAVVQPVSIEVTAVRPEEAGSEVGGQPLGVGGPGTVQDGRFWFAERGGHDEVEVAICVEVAELWNRAVRGAGQG
jgi:hypothetical protein